MAPELEAAAPALQARFDALRALRNEVSRMAAEPTPDRTAIDAQLEALRTESLALQADIQKATYDALLKLPAGHARRPRPPEGRQLIRPTPAPVTLSPWRSRMAALHPLSLKPSIRREVGGTMEKPPSAVRIPPARTGAPCAYATLVTNEEYGLGALALVRSLRWTGTDGAGRRARDRRGAASRRARAGRLPHRARPAAAGLRGVPRAPQPRGAAPRRTLQQGQQARLPRPGRQFLQARAVEAHRIREDRLPRRRCRRGEADRHAVRLPGIRRRAQRLRGARRLPPAEFRRVRRSTQPCHL